MRSIKVRAITPLKSHKGEVKGTQRRSDEAAVVSGE